MAVLVMAPTWMGITSTSSHVTSHVTPRVRVSERAATVSLSAVGCAVTNGHATLDWEGFSGCEEYFSVARRVVRVVGHGSDCGGVPGRKHHAQVAHHRCRRPRGSHHVRHRESHMLHGRVRALSLEVRLDDEKHATKLNRNQGQAKLSSNQALDLAPQQSESTVRRHISKPARRCHSAHTALEIKYNSNHRIPATQPPCWKDAITDHEFDVALCSDHSRETALALVEHNRNSDGDISRRSFRSSWSSQRAEQRARTASTHASKQEVGATSGRPPAT